MMSQQIKTNNVFINDGEHEPAAVALTGTTTLVPERQTTMLPGCLPASALSLT